MSPNLTQTIQNAFLAEASDVFLIEGEAPRIRRDGALAVQPGETPSRSDMAGFWAACGVSPDVSREADVSWQAPDGGRLRVNLYHTLGRLAAVLRPIRSQVPLLAELGLPAALLESWLERRYGLILVTGPTGSGKSTTVASCLDWVNRNQSRHIVTLEDPIEYLFENRQALFSQREVRQDSGDFASGLRAALRQSPDVLFIGEIRDAETAVTALQAAETGHLVISTLHSSSVAETIDRFSHLLDGGAATAAMNLLAAQLVGVISQRLLPRLGGGLFAALEYLQNEAATRTWIQERKLAELNDHMAKVSGAGCCALLDYLVAATRQGFVEAEVARAACPRPQDFDRAMRGITG